MEIEMLMITIMIVFIIDLSGFVLEVKRAFWKLLFGKKSKFVDFSFKPFTCSLCMTWWTLLIYLFITKQNSIYAFFIASVLSYYTTLIGFVMIFIQDATGSVMNKITDFIK